MNRCEVTNRSCTGNANNCTHTRKPLLLYSTPTEGSWYLLPTRLTDFGTINQQKSRLRLHDHKTERICLLLNHLWTVSEGFKKWVQTAILGSSQFSCLTALERKFHHDNNKAFSHGVRSFSFPGATPVCDNNKAFSHWVRSFSLPGATPVCGVSFSMTNVWR